MAMSNRKNIIYTTCYTKNNILPINSAKKTEDPKAKIGSDQLSRNLQTQATGSNKLNRVLLKKSIKLCQISLPIDKGGRRSDMSSVSIENNDILYGLYLKKSLWKKDSQFVISDAFENAPRIGF